MFLDGQTDPDGLYDFALGGITEDDILTTAQGANYEAFFTLFPGSGGVTSYIGAIESLSVTVVSVTEPASFLLVGAGAVALWRRRRSA